MDPVLKKLNQIQAFPHCFSKMHFNTTSFQTYKSTTLRLHHYLIHPLQKPCGITASDKNIFNSLSAHTKLQKIFTNGDMKIYFWHITHTVHFQNNTTRATHSDPVTYVLIIQHLCTLEILLLTLSILQIPKLTPSAYKCVWGWGKVWETNVAIFCFHTQMTRREKSSTANI